MISKINCRYILVLLSLMLTFTACDRNLNEERNRTNNIQAAKRPIGTSAREILSSSQFESMEVEIQYMVGYEPTDELVASITSFLEELVNKPGGIRVYQTAIAPVKKPTYNVQEIREIEDANRNSYNMGNKLGLYILFLDGYSSEDTNNNTTLALVHRNTSVAMFGKRIRERSDRIGHPSRSLLESTVTRHELGHLMGLVNVGSAMQHSHEDPDNAGHCDERNCLMYWAVESGSVFNLVQQGTVPLLDENCKKDLKANGGR